LVFHLELSTTFSAAHALRIASEREPLHGHDWHVTATISGPDLDADGLLVDFHAIMHDLESIVRPFHNRNLNEVPPFVTLNPSAELVARHIGVELAARLAARLSGPDQTAGSDHPKQGAGRTAVVSRVRVTEAVGCAAVWTAPGQ
jgi:6-pyruvoyltetrahydropterin/6-carboxytetrahydropterin synthase